MDLVARTAAAGARRAAVLAAGAALALGSLGISGCLSTGQETAEAEGADAAAGGSGNAADAVIVEDAPAEPSPEELRAGLDIAEDYRDEFVHGEKGAEHQKYIVLHDTEVDASPEAIVSSWDGADQGVAAHFVIGRDGHVVQCVPLDKIAHHAGNGDTGHNAEYGVEDESRDDQVGRKPAPSGTADYGMNSYSIGIELVHVGGEGDYPAAQLEALDALIAYIDAYYGEESQIIDHKAWRTGNSDTSPEFAEYLANYQDHRTHD